MSSQPPNQGELVVVYKDKVLRGEHLKQFDNRRNEDNYCRICEKKLDSGEKAKSHDAGFLHPICKVCAYTLAYEFVNHFGFPKSWIRDGYLDSNTKYSRIVKFISDAKGEFFSTDIVSKTGIDRITVYYKLGELLRAGFLQRKKMDHKQKFVFSKTAIWDDLKAIGVLVQSMRRSWIKRKLKKLVVTARRQI